MFDLRCDTVLGLASHYLLCLGLALLVLSIKVHQLWLKIKFCFLLSLLFLLPHLNNDHFQLTDTAKSYMAHHPTSKIYRTCAIIAHRNIKIFMCRIW